MDSGHFPYKLSDCQDCTGKFSFNTAFAVVTYMYRANWRLLRTVRSVCILILHNSPEVTLFACGFQAELGVDRMLVDTPIALTFSRIIPKVMMIHRKKIL